MHALKIAYVTLKLVVSCVLYPVLSRACLDVPNAALAPAAAPSLTDGTFTSAPVDNNQDMFDKAFGAPDSSPFGVQPVAMV